ncbi:hypothetical protein [Pseudomonas chlororaphis]|uniref:Permease n=1 Tax=Pseudomonas chlororaphis O6 TaxID=1037915 RepID=A0AB33WS82_9PSED|nr:hypothetical protein [Pseudomonas chlororaphis]EIM15702.1 hypothetical protein PchlO6_2597 [Pseudomonas chlororaphis O6]
MDKQQAKRQVIASLEAGRSRGETFAAFAGSGIKERLLAFWIAGYSDPKLYALHRRKIQILLAVMLLQAVVGAVAGFFLGSVIGPKAAWVFGLLGGVVPLLFAWGFHKPSVNAYSLYALLTLSQFPRLFEGYAEDPLGTLIGAAMTLGVVFFAMYVRSRIFPDFAFIGPRKVKGRYVFSS